MQRWIVALSTACARFPWRVVLLAMVLLGGAAIYDVRSIAIDTDSAKLISAELPWRKREAAFDAAFPQRTDLVAIVVDGATPELAEQAAATILERLVARPDLFKTARRPDGGAFFARNGLLFLSPEEVTRTTEQLVAAQPLLGSLAADPSLRGIMGSLQLALEGVRRGDTSLATLQPAFAALARTAEGALAGRPVPLSWQQLLGGGPADPRSLRRFVLAQPKLDYSAIQPGEAATAFIREAARSAGFDAAHGVRVRLTGDVPMADEEFATLGENAGRNAFVMLAALLGMLWLAVRSLRIVLAIVASLVVGLAASAALGLLVFGAFNLISVAFAVLFVGLGVDFGIQYAVAYRAAAQRAGRGDAGERGNARNADDATGAGTAQARSAAAEVGGSLALAALAIAAGFYAFAPTDYRGVSELGVIAGSGMLIAFFASITLLPALLQLMRPGGGATEMGLAALAPVDGWLARHRRAVLAAAGLAALASLAALPWLRFDFNPLHLRSAASESVATLNDLAADIQTSPDTLGVLAPSLPAAQALADKLAALPEVAQVLTLASFVPEQQAAKLAAIGDAAMLLEITLSPTSVKPAPTDAEDREAMQATASALKAVVADASASAQASASPAASAASTAKAADADAARLGAALAALAQGAPAQRQAFAAAAVPGLQTTLKQAAESLRAGPVTLASLPDDLRRDWIAADGRARIEVFPRPGKEAASFGDDGNESLRRFVAAVHTVAPEAGGAPVAIQESARTVIGAFVEAGLWALVAISALLALALRRLVDVLRTLASLLLGGLVTLGLCVVLRIALNFENIIALPLLFGIGVAFNIYFVIAWRRGTSELLQTPIARAVIFSALTTATAFGSLWLSSHPGTASMGKLLALSLACTLAAALFVLPALLGPAPRRQPDRAAEAG